MAVSIDNSITKLNGFGPQHCCAARRQRVATPHHAAHSLPCCIIAHSVARELAEGSRLSTDTAPLRPREALGRELLALRLRAVLSGEEVAGRIGTAQSL